MKNLTTFSLIVATVIGLTGCGGGGSSSSITKEVNTPKFLNETFKVDACTDTSTTDTCIDAEAFNLHKHNVLVLSAEEKLDASDFVYFKGKRFGILPKETTEYTPVNFLAYGLFLLAEEKRKSDDKRIPWIEILSYSDAQKYLENNFNLTGTEGQNKVIMKALNYNLELFGAEGISIENAYYADIKAMAESLVNLTVKKISLDLSNLAETQDDDFTQTSSKLFTLDKTKVRELAFNIRKEENNPSKLDEIFTKYECKENQTKQLYIYGVYDGFNPNNPEPTHPSTTLLSAIPSNMVPMLSQYDHAGGSINQPSIFMETLTGLPTNLSHGAFIMGLKEKGVNIKDKPYFVDRYSIGDGLFTPNNVQGLVSQLRTTWQSPASNVYFKELSQLNDASGQSLLSKLQGGQTSLDVSTYLTTNIDFIGVMACENKIEVKPIPIAKIPTKITCNEKKGEQLLTIWGGTADDFAQPVDATNPSAAAGVWQGNISNKYDAKIEKVGKFADTLQNPNMHISQLELLINTRPSVTTGSSVNDTIFVGDTASQVGTFYNPNSVGIPTANGGTAHLIYNASIRSLMNSNFTDLDILVGQQTEVDTVRLNICVIKDYTLPCDDDDADGICNEDDCAPLDPNIWENCEQPCADDDKDGVCNEDDCAPYNPKVWENCLPESCNESITLDLRQATSWEDEDGNNPTIHNAAITTWDGSMNWFHFGSESHSVHKLNLDFCACGDTQITIDKLKTDNSGKIYLDSDTTPLSWTNTGNYIASIDSYSSWAMTSSGPTISGTEFVGNSTLNGVDHSLHFDVRNNRGAVGGAMNGTLDFVGHLGQCTPADRPDIDTNTGGGGISDSNLTVIYEEKVPVDVTDIILNPTPSDGGNFTAGTVILSVAGPIVLTNPHGKPYIVNDPNPIVIPFDGKDATPIKDEDLPAGNPNPSGYPVYVGCDGGHIRIVSYTAGEGWGNTYTETPCEGSGGAWI